MKDSIYIESKDSPYAVVVAARQGDEKKPGIEALVKALRSDKVKKFMLDTYAGGVVPVW